MTIETKTTGQIRRMDDLGRIVIPKEVRRKVGIREGDPFEVEYDERGVYFKKYVPEESLLRKLHSLIDCAIDEPLSDQTRIEVVSALRKAEAVLRSKPT